MGQGQHVFQISYLGEFTSNYPYFLIIIIAGSTVLLEAFCNNVSVICNHVIVTGYVLLGEITCNKYPVLLFIIIIISVVEMARVRC